VIPDLGVAHTHELQVPTPENVRFLAAVRRLDQLVYALIARRREHHAAQVQSNSRTQCCAPRCVPA
jgi:cytochrome P450